MIDDWAGGFLRNSFVTTNDLVPTLQVQYPGRMCEQLCIADNHRRADALHFLFRYGLQDDLRTDPGGVANRDTNPWQMLPQTELSLHVFNAWSRNARIALKGSNDGQQLRIR
jgi:hypothetical protein